MENITPARVLEAMYQMKPFYYAKIEKLCGKNADREEIFHRALITGARYIPKYYDSSKGTLENFVKHYAYWLIAREMNEVDRKKKLFEKYSEKRSQEAIEQLEREPWTPEAEMDQRLDLDALLNSYPPRVRAIFEGLQNGKSLSDVAREEGVSKQRVAEQWKNFLNSAKLKLEAQMQNETNPKPKKQDKEKRVEEKKEYAFWNLEGSMTVDGVQRGFRNLFFAKRGARQKDKTSLKTYLNDLEEMFFWADLKLDLSKECNKVLHAFAKEKTMCRIEFKVNEEQRVCFEGPMKVRLDHTSSNAGKLFEVTIQCAPQKGCAARLME